MAFDYNTAKLHIDGKWIESTATEFSLVRSPSTVEIIGCAPNSTTADIDCASYFELKAIHLPGDSYGT